MFVTEKVLLLLVISLTDKYICMNYFGNALDILDEIKYLKAASFP